MVAQSILPPARERGEGRASAAFPPSLPDSTPGSVVAVRSRAAGPPPPRSQVSPAKPWSLAELLEGGKLIEFHQEDDNGDQEGIRNCL